MIAAWVCVVHSVYSLDGRGRGSAAGHAGVGGVSPGPRPGGGQPAQQGLLGVQRGHAWQQHRVQGMLCFLLLVSSTIIFEGNKKMSQYSQVFSITHRSLRSSGVLTDSFVIW